jgi:hypothetical protein
MAKLYIQTKSVNHGDNRNIGPKKSTSKLPIQAASANYQARQISGKKTPSPPAKPYGPTLMNAPKPTGTVVKPKIITRAGK